LVEVEAEELCETRRIRIHMRPAISEGFQNGEQRIQLLDR
jgi:hypothetical protein